MRDRGGAGRHAQAALPTQVGPPAHGRRGGRRGVHLAEGPVGASGGQAGESAAGSSRRSRPVLPGSE